jgi:hypothetical protein
VSRGKNKEVLDEICDV